MPTIANILNALPDPVILLDADRVILRANNPALEILGDHVIDKDLAQAIRHPRVLETVDKVLISRGQETGELRLTAPVPRLFQLHAAGVNTDPDAPDEIGAAAILVLTDMTKAKRSEQMRADFVANASHELRSPLSALLGFIETLKGPASNDEKARQRFLDIMHREAHRMARLIDDLLSLSHVEINEHVRPTTLVSVSSILIGVTESLSDMAAQRNMVIRVNQGSDEDTSHIIGDGLPAVSGDPDELGQVFRNLIENAIRYGREGTGVEIKVETIDRIRDTGQPGIAVHVIDQGDGIPQDAIPRLTERFYRVDKARSKSMGGTGLGLAIVKHIVNRHRGRLAVQSTLGTGSQFTVYLPVVAPIVAEDEDQTKISLVPVQSLKSV